MFKPIKYLILREFNESLRSRWLVAYSLSYLLLGLSLTQFSLMGISYLGFKAVGRIMATLINLALYLIPLISLILGSISIVGEKESGIIEWIFSEPIGVLEYVLGKYIGILISIILATLLGFGLASWIITIALPPEDILKYLSFLLVGLLLSAASLSIGTLLSVVSRGRFEALGLSFLIWFAMIFIYDLMIMGLTISVGLSEHIVFLLTILNPVETARILMIYLIDPTLTFLGPTGIYAARELGNMLYLILTLLLVLYTIIPLIITIMILRGRDIIT